MAVEFSHTNQSRFYSKSHSSLYHNLMRKLWKKKRLFLFIQKQSIYGIIEVGAILFAGFFINKI